MDKYSHLIFVFRLHTHVLYGTYTCSLLEHVTAIVRFLNKAKKNLAIASLMRILYSALKKKKREESTLLTWLCVPLHRPACVGNLASQNNIKTEYCKSITKSRIN